MRKQTIIDTRRNDRGIQTWLAVDEDDVVHEIVQDPQRKEGAVIQANLGVRVTQSGTLALDKVLPAGNVAIAARRVSLADSSQAYVILAWGFPSGHETLTPYCHIYIFSEDHGKIKQTANQRLGSRLVGFIVEDLNGDGNFEVLATTHEYGFELMDIWQIRVNGEVRKVQTIEAERISTIQDRFLDGDFGIVAEENAEKCVRAEGCGVCHDVIQYKWSAKEAMYVAVSH